MDKQFSPENLNKIEKKLTSLLEQTPSIASNEQLVGKYLSLIQAIVAKGHSLNAIVDVLSECGIDIPVKTLRAYINRQKSKTSDDKASVAGGEDAAAAPLADTPPARRRRSGKSKKESTGAAEKSAVQLQPSLAAAGQFTVSSDEV